ncbi:MAG: flagellar type III secretion system pore protein FliP [Desulfamplus sp.]|nr:flagellar type III secretion system pore protein FliP [Desulfamplus sp.]MBF0241551.1 flagellar type III secretion system pore protein FliP [Desulfamplus sp.]MBF0389581.1 flagellar type III secretion system pore protein FliP [Desulfamplus sp.]
MGAKLVKILTLSLLTLLAAATFISLSPEVAYSVTFPIPSLKIGLEPATTPEDVAVVLEIVALLTILSLAPSILILMTPFTRIIVVFHFLRQAIGTQTSPPNQVIVGLALFMTFFIMRPVGQEIYDKALNPYLENRISYQEAFHEAQIPIRNYLLVNTREADIAMFVKGAKVAKPENRDSVSLLILIPAYVISELKTAFILGFILYVPFLVIDMVVSSVLLAMGMMMLPPVMISMPFKLMLFVLVDGWNLLIGSMMKSFGITF